MTAAEYQDAGSLMAAALERWNLPRPVVVVYSSRKERASINKALRDDANQDLVDKIHELGPARYGGRGVEVTESNEPTESKDDDVSLDEETIGDGDADDANKPSGVETPRNRKAPAGAKRRHKKNPDDDPAEQTEDSVTLSEGLDDSEDEVFVTQNSARSSDSEGSTEVESEALNAVIAIESDSKAKAKAKAASEAKAKTASKAKAKTASKAGTKKKAATVDKSERDDRVLVASRMIFEVPRTELQHVQSPAFDRYQVIIGEPSAPSTVKQAIQDLASDCKLQNSLLGQVCESRSFVHNAVQLYGSMERAVQSTVQQYSTMPRVAQSPNDGDIACLAICSLLIDAQTARPGAGVLMLSRLSHLIAPVVDNPCHENELTVLLERLRASVSTVYPALAASVVTPAIQVARFRPLPSEVLWQLKSVLQDSSVVTDAFSHDDANALSMLVDKELRIHSSTNEAGEESKTQQPPADTQLTLNLQKLLARHVKKVKGDGNCLFYALLGVNGEGYNDHKNAMFLRARIVEFIRNNGAKPYRTFHPKSKTTNTLLQEAKDNTDTDIDQYLKEMETSSDAYGGHVELVIGSCILDLCVYLFVNQMSELTIDTESPFGKQKCNPELIRFFRYTLNSSDASNLHYDLIDIQDPTSIVQQLQVVLTGS